jgi:hypothetical protein
MRAQQAEVVAIGVGEVVKLAAARHLFTPPSLRMPADVPVSHLWGGRGEARWCWRGNPRPEGATARSITDLWWLVLALGAAVFPANA